MIFITEKDIFKEGRGIYHIVRMIKESQKEVRDEQEIIYVNGEYEGEDEIGRLMHDFRCKEAREMYYEVLAKRVEGLKRRKEGEKEMGKILDEVRDEGKRKGIEETKIISIQSLMESMNWSIEEAMKALMIPPNEQEHFIKIIH